MKKVILLGFFLQHMLCFAQIGFTNLAGKWQEDMREQKKNTPTSFKDTIKMEIRPEGFMMVRYDIGPTFFGEAELKGKYLSIKEHDFEIQEVAENNLTLIDDKGIHYFKRVIEFGSSPVAKIIPGKEEGVKNISIETLKGKWKCYKKTDAKFDGHKFYLKSLNFIDDKGKGTYTGSAAFSNMDSVFVTDAFIYAKDNNLLISTDDETFKANVVKSNGEELILESGSILYFMKQFGKKD